METAMKKYISSRRILRLFAISLGCIIAGGGIGLFLVPHNLAPGGVSGIAIILAKFLPVPTGTLVLCLNIPLLFLGLWKFGRRFLVSTLYATVLFSLSIDGAAWIFGARLPLTEDYFLSAVFGGAASAVGLGLVFRFGCTTGGTDIVVKLLRSRYRHIHTGTLFLIVDLLIALSSAFAFQSIEVALYAVVSIVVNGLLMDCVIYGGNEVKLVYVVSGRYREIADRSLRELEIGATFLNGSGAYTNEEKQIVMIAVKKHLFPKLKDIVRELDSSAFMIVSSAQEIYGEGFRDYTRGDE